jgi:UDP-N-acetylmuramoyl-tripeptide--D-alanyl-D-alanine ligase
MPYSGYEILEATGGTLIMGSSDTVFDAVSTDTRESQKGNLFIPLKGERFDGHEFLPAAVASGAAGLLIEEGKEELLKGISGDVTVIRVTDTLAALGAVAYYRRKKFNIPVLAITGSAGKTTTKEMAACIMGPIKNTLKTEGNFNNLIGLPLTLLRLNDKHELAILEMGTNVPGEIARLSSIAAPDVGLITNVGPTHLEGLKSVDAVREEKGELFRSLAAEGIAVVNGDDDAVRALAERRQGRKVSFGIRTASDVTAEDIVSTGRGASFILRIGDRKKNVALAAAGVHSVMNALAAAAACWSLGADEEIIGRGLQSFKPISARMEIKGLKNGVFLINDTYNANPVSVREALLSLRDLKGKHKSAVILGDMLELGDRAAELHKEVGGIIAETGVDALFLKGAFSGATADGAQRKGMDASRIFFPSTPEDIVERLSSALQRGDWVLVKGSRAMRMEEIIGRITENFGLDEIVPEKE